MKKTYTCLDGRSQKCSLQAKKAQMLLCLPLDLALGPLKASGAGGDILQQKYREAGRVDVIEVLAQP